MEKNFDRKELAPIFDNIIPGTNGRWPSFSKCIPIASSSVEDLIKNNGHIIRIIFDGIHNKSQPTDLIKEISARNSSEFHKLYQDLCGLYYSSPSVIELITILAETGPHEASPYFDPELLNQVITSQAGKRRL